MTNDDDEIGVDLNAWEAPPPSSDLADAVLARVRAPEAAAAVEPAPVRRSRWWIAGGVAVAVALVGGLVFAMRGDDGADSSGAVAVAKPSHLELGATAVDLEADTNLSWVRAGKRVTAMQPRGTATYKVAPGDELRIDAGATVASVGASGASLRVEVEMNLSDARLIGTSAVTAAAVALVTVIVYEGHVNVTSGDKTVEVAAGSTVQITPNKPPEPDRIAGLEKRLRAEIDFLKLENEFLRKKINATPDDFTTAMRAATPGLQRCGAGLTGTIETMIVVDSRAKATAEFSKVNVRTTNGPKVPLQECFDSVLSKVVFGKTPAGSYEHTVTFAATVPAPIDGITQFHNSMASMAPALAKCNKGQGGELLVTIAVQDDGSPALGFPGGDLSDRVEECVTSEVKRHGFPPNAVGAYEHLIKFEKTTAPKQPADEVKPDASRCGDKAKIEETEARGEAALSAGNFAMSLQLFEQILPCKPSIVTKTYLAACRARNFPKAKTYFKAIGREALAQVCMKEGFDPR